MEITFLGTGSGVPAKHRNVSSLALKLLDERNSIWLFDCGEATQQQILHTTIKPRKIEKIFITHMHGDHIFGLPGLLSSRAFQGGDSPVTIYGPVGIKQFVLTSLKLSHTYLKYPVQFKEITEEGSLFKDETFEVSCGFLKHGITSIGYRIVENDHPGKLQIEKLKQYNIQSGPIFGQLKQGKTVVLEDGRKVQGKDFIGSPQKGRIITILGDTKKCTKSEELAKNATVLVHEGTFNVSEKKMAKDYNHSTVGEAAQIAKDANVQLLLLNHLSARYVGNDMKALESEAKNIFENTRIARDFMDVSIPLHKELKVDE